MGRKEAGAGVHRPTGGLRWSLLMAEIAALAATVMVFVDDDDGG